MENREIKIMGIINLTDNSFWSGSRMLKADGKADPGRVSEKVGAMLSEGASIIDIGACSTRPGSAAVGADKEWRRLSPVLQRLRDEFHSLRISIDTYWASVIGKAYDTVGDRLMINDVSAGELDEEMLPMAGRLGIPFIAMHMRGTPSTMQSLTDYADYAEPSEDEIAKHGFHLHPVTRAVVDYFRKFEAKAQEHGIKDWILDPGFGFAKTVEQNWQLLAEMDALKSFGKPILAGLSRKSMITKPLGITPAEALAPTQVANFAALERGADILRVHDVAAAVQTVELYRLMLRVHDIAAAVDGGAVQADGNSPLSRLKSGLSHR